MDFLRAHPTPSKFAQEHLYFSDGIGHHLNPNFFIDRNTFRNNLIMYVVKGTLHVEQGKHYILKEGESIIMRLSKKHKYYSDAYDNCEIKWIHLGGKHLESQLKIIESQMKLPFILKNENINKILTENINFYRKNGYNEFKISETIYKLLLEVMKYATKDTQTNLTNTNDTFKTDALTYIETHLYDNISIDEFAQHMHISKYHFIRKFKDSFGYTPLEYIKLQKIELSKILLVHTDKSIADISQSLGFYDQSHFCNLFKKINEITPTEYKRKHNY